jgi:NADPH2 dehydrogenase
MNAHPILRLGSLKDVARFKDHLDSLRLIISCDDELIAGPESPLRCPLSNGQIKIGNRIAVQPMEGWDSTADGNPTESTLRRWQRFGLSGGKLIWGGEAVAVSHEGRANPNSTGSGNAYVRRPSPIAFDSCRRTPPHHGIR